MLPIKERLNRCHEWEEWRKPEDKGVTEALRMEKALVVQKDEEIQAALLKTDKERDKVVQKFKQSSIHTVLQGVQDSASMDHEAP